MIQHGRLGAPPPHGYGLAHSKLNRRRTCRVSRLSMSFRQLNADRLDMIGVGDGDGAGVGSSCIGDKQSIR